MLPFTEMSNDLTKDIDIASSQEIVHCLNSCNSQIFDGYGLSTQTEEHYSLMDNEIIQRIGRVVRETSKLIESASEVTNNAIVFSGCGTSGRFAFLAAKLMQVLLKDDKKGSQFRIHYTISGGDKAFVMSTEAPEDDWNAGLKPLKELDEDPRIASVIFIGISCGLSAPYVAGQLHFCLNRLNKFFPVVIGFNPLNLARCNGIPSSGSASWSFRKVLMEMELQGDKTVLINPISGPEPITGSTRMKGGSVTKIILDTIVISSVYGYQHNVYPDVRNIFQTYHNLQKSVHKNNDYIVALAKAIDLAGKSLKQGGRLFYIGQSNTAGVLGLIDASECLPTFGTDFNDVRGFIKGGHQSLCLNDSDFCDKAGSCPNPDVSLSHFSSVFLPKLSCNDILVIIGSNPLNVEMTTILKEKILQSQMNSVNDGIKVVQVQLDQEIKYDAQCLDHVHCLIPSLDYNKETLLEGDTPKMFKSLLEDLATKWTLNGISSGAHVIKGKIYKNFMIDVKVSNIKLFHRAVDIIRDMSGVSRDEAEASLLQSIYGNDMDFAMEHYDVSDHIRYACEMDNVVPVSIVIAKTHDTISNAKKYLKKFGILRNAIEELSNSKLASL